jgi:hypothetical protein
MAELGLLGSPVLGEGDVGATELCLIREGLARHCTEAETAFAVQGLGLFPILHHGPESLRRTGGRGSRRARRWPPSR